ncbi:hypothetical protein PHAVU_003G244250 [Phaseolus vulgaris]|uniref:Protein DETOXIFICATION n=1 Tax=Phaseolus vulgaris TaxID=3885 RepID=V7B3K3_PHAVU|nr:hypothetical protein PHAVU_008G031700g [Phaseolus vulgaris]ESW11458.1 hypothetical protein PHAVU_008G031700g [Phaseolus vulgaris]
MTFSLRSIYEKVIFFFQMISSVQRVNSMTEEDHPVSSPLLSNYSDGSENKTTGLNDDTDNERSGSSRISEVVAEIKDLYTIALPVIITGLLTYGKSAISMHFLGKLGKEALAGGSLAIGIANITGYSVISGLATGMEGISSQACGARQWNLVGETLQSTVMILIMACIPISIFWLNVEPILLLIGQNATISSIAATYLAFSIPDLVCQSLINPLKIFMRIQGVTHPLMYSAGLTLLLHAITTYVAIQILGLGIQGISLVGAFTNLNVILILVLYLWFSGACSQCWPGWSRKGLKHWRPILAQGVPSCASVCLEWWWYELLVLFSGLLHNAADTVSAYGIIIQATALMYNFPNALSLALSTKVGTALGANKPNKAKASSFTALLCACLTAIVAMSLMMTMSRFWGLLFTHDEAILSLLTTVLPLVGLCELGNCPQTTICGMLNGSARPGLGANINFTSFYVVGLPFALLMCFSFHFGLLGLFSGLLVAQIVCASSMVTVLIRTNWKEEANRAKKLISGIRETNGENNEETDGAPSVC